jgi:hypothetical protein
MARPPTKIHRTNRQNIPLVQATRNNNNGNSGYLSHILKMEHTYGAITDIMDIIRTCK